ncbi:hypothetical protein ABB37_00848 [Leptomonas pyrrhocoris]|uniref:Uncharacterized protein n=1 Tax=Leptomonas pyrrhocoris TaxID=157538 RepID=A0A0N0VHZ0_LEPPY|nr:hypothetical protein ABB37_00848 [Leptomonas pyrrhocoris]KPA86781.1 hypothetical protein ABB37_00848 [Leptomonas pyrrhocoris]|eukprot:XP_015665220.1 hypothetical protein ABB37_00848 [Leptomonas pyrrhocoris]
MYREEDDGSVIVDGVAVAPFVPIQHGQVNIATMNLLGYYCFRFARERGWLQTSEELAQATPYAESNDARPLIEDEGHAYRGTENTFFAAGVEEALANPHPHFHYPPTPSTLLVCAHFWLVHVGNSSYGVYGKLFTYLDGQKDVMRHPLGTFKVTSVLVSKVKRTPALLEPSKLTLFRSILARGVAKGAPVRGDEDRVQRLSVRELLQSSGWFADAAAVAAMQLNAFDETPPPAFEVVLPGVAAPLRLLARRSFTLRETDIDFNLHVNQLVSKHFVINAFRGAVADASCAYSRLLRPGELPLLSDLLLRKFRIDYVREIPMRYVAVEVFLFPLDADRVRAQFRAACDASARVAGVEDDKRDASSCAGRSAPEKTGEVTDVMEIGFFTVGVAADDAPVTSRKFIATVGVMSAATCFLPQTLRPTAAAPSSSM